MEDKYAGMTVNERLYVSGQMGAFDEAVKNNNFDEVRRILEKVNLKEESITPILMQLTDEAEGET